MSINSLPKISIVTPSFNQGNFIKQTVRSVLDQGYLNLEYIVMDGGSTDHTLEVLEPYIKHFSHFESGPDDGQSDAIRRGFDLSCGTILAYLNSDDILLPGTLDFVADFFQRNPDIDFIYSHRCFIDNNNNVKNFWILPPHVNYLMSHWDFIPQETCFWRRRLYDMLGSVDSSFKFAMDYDLFVRYMSCTKFRRVDRFLSAFRVHKDSKTTNQYLTIGKEEIKRIYCRYKLVRVPFIGRIFRLVILLNTMIYITFRAKLPGLPVGINYNLSQVWDILDNNDLAKRCPVRLGKA